MAGRAVPSAIVPTAARECRCRHRRGSRLSPAPAALDSFAPARYATPPAARQRPRPESRICGGKVSLASSPSLSLLRACKWARRAMPAWIDRTNDGLSGMPADGISLPPKKGDFGTSRWGGSKVRLHQPRDWGEGHDRLWHYPPNFQNCPHIFCRVPKFKSPRPVGGPFFPSLSAANFDGDNVCDRGDGGEHSEPYSSRQFDGPTMPYLCRTNLALTQAQALSR